MVSGRIHNLKQYVSLSNQLFDKKLISREILTALPSMIAMSQNPTYKLKSLKKFFYLQNLSKKYLRNIIHVIKQSSSAYLISSALKLIRLTCKLLAYYFNLGRKILVAALKILRVYTGRPCLDAFLLVRKLALTFPGPILDWCVKGAIYVYFELVNHRSDICNDQINFMINSVIDLMSLNIDTCYKFTHEYVRNSAQKMKLLISNKANEDFRVFKCMVENLNLWSSVLSSYSKWPELQPFQYSIVQLIFTAIRIRTSPKDFPIRIRLLSFLNRVAKAYKSYIPVSTLFLENLQSIDSFFNSSKRSCMIDHPFTNKTTSTSAMNHKIKQVDYVLLIVEGISDHLIEFDRHPAFSDLSIYILLLLQRCYEQIQVVDSKNYVLTLMQAIKISVQIANNQNISCISSSYFKTPNEFYSTCSLKGLKHYNKTIRKIIEKNQIIYSTYEIQTMSR
jgi:hypothetical protein